MELKGEIPINANREKVWQSLNDTQLLMRCIPGCESMEELSPNERQATVKIKIGPVRARFTGKVKMIDIHPLEGYTLQFEGSGGAAGMAKGQSVVTLSDEGASTLLSYTVQASIGGKLGQVGGRMIDAAAKQIADQFFAVLQAELSGATSESAVDLQSNAESKSSVETQQKNIPTPSHPSSVQQEPSLLIRTAPQATPSTQSTQGESVRMTWFILGVLSTALGVWLGHLIS
jgi:carbon monoxide dehydrogenase subunit G